MDLDGEGRPSVGRMALLSKLGQGGMGVVYHGVHPRLGTEVAIKVLPLALHAQQEGLVERFLREAQLAARLRSPHLVGVLDVDHDADSRCHFIVMEYVHGADARQWARRYTAAGYAGAPEADALDVCIAATRGLAAAHVEGVVHRDIKPGNILIPCGADGTPRPAESKLADLGLARSDAGSERSLTGTQLAMGTPGYMAPEQAQDAKRAKKPADVFGMGATLYALLAGRAPFAGSSPAMALVNTIQGSYPDIRGLRPDLSPGTIKLLETTLATAPKERFPDAPALLEALEVCRGALGQLASSADPETVVASLVTRSEQGKRVVTNTANAHTDEMTTGDIADDVYDRVIRAANAGAEPGSATRLVAARAVGEVTPDASPSPSPAPSRGKGPWVLAACVLVAAAVALPLWQPWAPPSDGGTNTERDTTSLREAEPDRRGRVELPPVVDEPVEPPGLYVTSEPTEAAVEVDGVRHGLTPLLVPGLAEGGHEVRVTLDGHEAWTSTEVRTRLEERTPIHVEMSRATSAVRFDGGAAGAQVVLTPRDEALETRRTTLGADGTTTLDAVPTGAYDVVASRSGYTDYSGELVVAVGESALVETSMAALPALLTIRSDPPAAEVFDGDVLLGTTPLEALAVAVEGGPHTLSVRAPGHVTWRREVTLLRGQAADLGSVDLQPWGTLNLSGLAADVTVTIAGAPVNGETRVPPEPVRLQLSRPGCASQVQEARVAPGTAHAITAGPWVPLTGRLDLSALGGDVSVTWSGRSVTSASELPPGPHTLTITRRGYADQQRVVTVQAGRTVVMDAVSWPRRHPWDGFGVGSSVSYTMEFGGAQDRRAREELAKLLAEGGMTMTQTLKRRGPDAVVLESETSFLAGEPTTEEMRFDEPLPWTDAPWREEKLAVPAGRFLCRRYSYTSNESQVDAWVCDRVPGGLVKMVQNSITLVLKSYVVR